MSQPPDPDSALPPESPAFPPESIEAFLRFCAGEWMSLRSRFALAQSMDNADEGDEWHTSERGELVVAYLEPAAADSPGGLQVGPKGEPSSQLLFAGDGSFQSGTGRGTWQLWPDGSLELVIADDRRELRERIWFTKPNLRLRSTLEHRADGSPGRASFSSEIRRVSRQAPADG
ncbi:phycobiliprotein lyase [Cyanobium sp. CH-040]|uniref:phycobiliprotein lyase n=1 Tax=Cyanobium sp. CH-040 TaxID=2823708 RepID=UPI0020CE1001|nr:phycobiliprotein lyase [Cyanobium sp. CH-040]MCP9928666.1 phycobiliprotein lyase [Cyanobium sp. CH-040]